MNKVNPIGRQTFYDYFSSVKSNKNECNQDGFKSVLSKQIHEKVSDRFNNYGKSISIPYVISNKLNAEPESKFEDVTTNEDFVYIQECGECKVFRAYLDNGEGDGERASFIIRLKPCNRDANIDSNKLQYIFEKALTIVKKIVPIYAKMNGTAILAGIDYQLPFCEATGKVDFKMFTKDLMEGLKLEISNLSIDDDSKEELQKMLKECEDALWKAIDDEQQEKPEVVNDIGNGYEV